MLPGAGPGAGSGAGSGAFLENFNEMINLRYWWAMGIPFVIADHVQMFIKSDKKCFLIL